MTLLLSEARTTVSDHLDDDGTRWPITAGGPVDKALKAALSACLGEVVKAGVDRFDEEVTTSTTALGALDLSTYDPIKVCGVSVTSGSRYYPVAGVREEDRDSHDENVRALQVRLVRNFALSSTAGHPLVGVGATAAKSTEAFDNWVCARAALLCATKDAEARPEVAGLAAEYKAAVLGMPRIPASNRMPRAAHGPPGVAGLGWIWKPSTQVLQLCRRRRGWW